MEEKKEMPAFPPINDEFGVPMLELSSDSDTVSIKGKAYLKFRYFIKKCVISIVNECH